MAQFKCEVWSVPGIATFHKKIAALRPDSASGTLYRRQSGRGNLTIPAGYDRLDEIITVDPNNHANDVASLIRVYRGSDLIQELLVPVSPNLVADQPATLSCQGVEAIMDWAIVECWDWDGSADFTSTVPDWIYGGRNLIPDLALGDLGSIREEWEVYLSGERYDFDVVGSGGVYNFTVDGNTTADIAWDASRSTIKSALEALAGVTEVSVVQADPDTLSFIIVFEDPKDLAADMTKGGAAATTLTKLNDGFDPSTNPTFTLTVDGQTTSALDWDATAKQVEGSPLGAQPGLEGLSNVNDVTVSGEGIASDPWSVTFYDPPDPTSFTATFAAGTAVLTKIVEGDVDPSPVTVSQSADASRNPTTHGTYSDPPIQVVTTPLDTGADWSLLVNATGQYAGSQIILNGVTPGQIYQASINVRPTVTGLYTLVIRDEFENLIATTTPRDNLLTAGSFQTLSIADVEIPEGVTRIIMRVAVTDPTSGNWADFYVNWQGAEFREGQAATTAGQVILDLLADAQTDHASGGFPRDTIDFINASFDATNDTASAAWADAELSINIPRGMTYRKVLDRVFGQLGYEWNLTPTSGTPGEWDLNVWNPDGRGTDWSSADTPSLLLGQGTLGGSATRQVPQANRIISEGAGQFTTRARNTASEGTIGSREWYQADVSYRGSQAEAWTDKTLARFLDVSLQPRFEIADPPDTEWPVPVVDYGLADVLNVDLADGAGKVSRTVEAISWRTVADGIRWGVHTGEAQFDAFPSGAGGAVGFGGGSEGDGRGAVAVAPQRQSVALSGPVDEGVRRLLDQFDRLERPELASAFDPGGKGGAPTVVVAAANASQLSKDKADFICSGTSGNPIDLATINEAIQSVADAESLRLLLTEGDYYLDLGQGGTSGFIEFVVNDGATMQGLGMNVTRLNLMGTGVTTAVVSTPNFATIRDLSFHDFVAGGATSVSAISVEGLGCKIDNCYFTGSFLWSINIAAEQCDVSVCRLDADEGIRVAGSNVSIRDCSFTNANNATAIDIDASSFIDDIVISGCQFNSSNSGDIGIDIGQAAGGKAQHVVIRDCIWRSGAVTNIRMVRSNHVYVINNTFWDQGDHDISMDGCGPVVIAGNTMYTSVDVARIYATGADRLTSLAGELFIVGNQFGAGAGEGIRVESSNSVRVVDNDLREIGEHGIVFNGVTGGVIAGNRIDQAGLDADNTYDGIHLEGDTDRAYIHGNYVLPSTTAADTRYAVNVSASTCDCNVIVGNVLSDPADYGIDAINDAGTDTQWKYPDDPVYGDNFTECAPTPS